MKPGLLWSLLIILLPDAIPLQAQQFSLRHFSVNEGVVQSDVNKIIQDSKSYIWVATNGGVSRFDGLKIKNYKIPISQIAYDIVEGDNNELFTLMRKGVGMIRNDSIYSYIFDADMQLGKCRNLVFNDGKLWMVTNRGITFFDGKHFVTGSLKSYDPSAVYFSISKNKVTWFDHKELNFLQQDDGFSYFSNKYQVFRKKGNVTELIFEAPENDRISTMLIDKEKRLWIGTQNGVFYSHSLAFIKYFIPDLLGNRVWGIVEDNNKNLWFTSFGQGLTKFDGTKFEKIDSYKKVVKTDSFYIGSTKKADGTILFSTINGIFRLKGQQFSRVVNLPSQIYLHIFEDCDSKMMIYAGENSLVVETGDSVKVYDNLKYHLPQIFDIIKDKNNIYRMGGAESSVFFDGKSFLNPDISRFGYIKGMYSSVADSRGNIWIATRYGIMLYDYTTCKTVLSEDINETVFDLKSYFGKIYFGTIKSVGLIDPKRFYHNQRAVSYFDFKNGYPGEEVVQNGAVVTSDSSIWIPSTRGVIKFSPSLVKLTKHISAVRLDSLVSYNRKGVKNTVSGYEIEKNNKIELLYKNRDIEINYHCIFFSNSEGVIYKYILENYDYAWREVPFNVRSLTYDKLPAGKYTFKISAFSKEGDVTENPAVIYITIYKPFWQRWWFLLMSSSLLIYLVFEAFRSIKRKERKKNETQQQLLKLKADALAAQMNPHFVFNCISSINALINIGDKQAATLYLGRFATLLRSVLKSVRVNEISLEEELQMIENYMQLEQARYSNPFNYTIKRPKGVSPSLILIPPLIIHPFVENSILHGYTGIVNFEKKIDVLTIITEDRLLVMVQDNGSGFTDDKKNGTGLGIKITKERIALLENNAFVDIDSITNEFDHGTKVTISIPLKLKK